MEWKRSRLKGISESWASRDYSNDADRRERERERETKRERRDGRNVVVETDRETKTDTATDNENRLHRDTKSRQKDKAGRH